MEPSWSPISIGDGQPRRTGKIRKNPSLCAEMEHVLCRRWRDYHDISAAHQLTDSYRRLVVMIAKGYSAYSVGSEEVISEGFVGLMRAVCQFDPDCGVRFGTYAIWWIRATILEYILRDSRLTKKTATASQMKLFSNLCRMRGHLRQFNDSTSEPAHGIESLLQVLAHELISVNPRKSSANHSLNTPISANRPSEWHTWLVNDDGNDQETAPAKYRETEHRKSVLPSAQIGHTLPEWQVMV
jgi:RNA polymerase sigma-32 factor